MTPSGLARTSPENSRSIRSLVTYGLGAIVLIAAFWIGHYTGRLVVRTCAAQRELALSAVS
jgi:hypothetical protein